MMHKQPFGFDAFCKWALCALGLLSRSLDGLGDSCVPSLPVHICPRGRGSQFAHNQASVWPLI